MKREPRGSSVTTRERLLKVAGDLILSKSYAGVSVEDVCRRAKARKGSFYHFFESKRDLVLEVIDRGDRLCEETLFIPAFRSGLSPLSSIRCFFDIMCSFEEQEFKREGRLFGCLSGNLALEMGTQDEKIRLRTRGVFEKFAAFFEQALSDGIKLGEMRRHDVHLVAQQMVAFLEGALLLAKANRDPALFHRLCPGALVLATQAGRVLMASGEPQNDGTGPARSARARIRSGAARSHPILR